MQPRSTIANTLFSWTGFRHPRARRAFGAGACVALMAAAGAGCLGDASDAEDPLSIDHAALVQTGTKWPSGEVSVCWDRTMSNRDPQFAAHSRTVRDAVEGVWHNAAAITFKGWKDCRTDIGNGGSVVIRLTDNASDASAPVGFQGNITPTIVTIGGARSNLVATALVLFGKALGFAKATNCSTPTASSGNALDTPGADPLSIMASMGACNNATTLSEWDYWGVQNLYARPNYIPTAPLATAYSAGRTEYVTVANYAGRVDQDNTGGYTWMSRSGWAFHTEMPGTVPLTLWWSAARQDNVLVSTEAGGADAFDAGYLPIRREAYVYQTPRTGTVPLKLYWSWSSTDNVTTADPALQAQLVSEGYQFIRDEGHVYPDHRYVSWIGPFSEEYSGLDPLKSHVLCPGAGYGVIGAGCFNSLCDDMLLWCSPISGPGGLVSTTPDGPDTWTDWASEERTSYVHNGNLIIGYEVGCDMAVQSGKLIVAPSRKVIDGMRAAGGNSDDISLHCATLPSGRSLTNCSWTAEFSDNNYQTFPDGQVAVAVRCFGSNCDRMQYHTCTVN